MKKFTFLSLALICLISLIYSLKPIIGSLDIILSFSTSTLIYLLTLCGLILLTSLFLTLFICFTTGWKLSSFSDFNPILQFSPSIKNLSALITIIVCLIYFLSINQKAQNGLPVPDSLIDSALKISQSDLSIPPELLSPSSDLIKSQVKETLEKALIPYAHFIAPALSVALFFTLQSINSIFSWLINPLLKLIFYILEKTGFVKFETEMKQAKKLII